METEKIRVPAVIGGLLFVTALTLWLSVRWGWTEYRGLSDVAAIAADNNGRVWVMRYHELVLYQDHADPIQIPLPAELGSPSSGALLVDDQGRVWAGTDHGDVGMRGINGEWVFYSSSINESIRDLVMDGEGRVWVRSRRGLAQIDPSAEDRTFVFTSSASPDHDPVAMTTDSQGQLWVLYWNREIKVLEPGDIWRTHTTAPNIVNNSSFGAQLAIDTWGGIWVASNQGVAVMDPEGRWTEHRLGDLKLPPTLYDIVPGPDGRIWAASAALGVFAFDPNTGWTNYNSLNSGLASDIVTSLAYDPGGRIWIGSDQGRLYRWDPDAASLDQILPALNVVMYVLLPAAFLVVVLILLLRIASGSWQPVTRRNIRAFWFGFAGWFICNALLWGWILYSISQLTGWVFIPPAGLIPFPLNVLMMLILYASHRWVALGSISAFLVNWILTTLVVPFTDETCFSAVCMLPFFFVFFITARFSHRYPDLPG